MYSFRNDYSEGAHEAILQKLAETNRVQTNGYGEDPYCEEAKKLIKKRIQNPEASVHFLTGGTQTNLLLISSLLRPHEAVICTLEGHINVHETGAVEATGHKVLTAETKDGKITKEQIEKVLSFHDGPHMVKPRMVYISNSTELGTIYKKRELEALSHFCHQNNLLLYIDGARLGSALCSEENDLTMADLSSLADGFTIGGTKNGAFFGEALVICKKELDEDFSYLIKQKGALLAKGRLLGIQFQVLFENQFYEKLAKDANKQAMRLKKGLTKQGVKFLTDSSTNQLFPILYEDIAAELKREYDFEWIRRMDKDHICIRLVTSWATPKEAVDEFLISFEKIQKNKY